MNLASKVNEPAVESANSSTWNPPITLSWVLGIVIIALACILRVAAGLDEFWLDEIWTWMWAQEAETSLDILTRIKHDNNHVLNTLIVDLMPPNAHWFYYRLPAMIAGALAVGFAGAVHWKKDRLESLILMFLLATNYLLIHYASEARGYGYLMLFSIAAVYLADRSFSAHRPINDLVFSLVAVLGIASHATFLFCLIAIGTWFAWRWWHDAALKQHGVATVLRCFVAPFAYGVWNYFTITSQMQIGGGSGQSIGTTVTRLLSVNFGGLAEGHWNLSIVALIGAIVLVASLIWMWQRNSHWAVLYVTALFFAPAMVLILVKPNLLFERYFLVPSIFISFVVANLMANLIRRSKLAAALVALLICGMLSGNALSTARLVRLGRAHYCDVLEIIRDEASSPNLLLSGDHDTRHSAAIDFFQRTTTADNKVTFILESEIPVEGVGWFLRHNSTMEPDNVERIEDRHGNRYQRIKLFENCGYSGCQLSLYRQNDGNESQ